MSYSPFNYRFTELINEMTETKIIDGKETAVKMSAAKAREMIANNTGGVVYARTLINYQITEKKEKEDKNEKKEKKAKKQRELTPFPSAEVLQALAKFFNVDPRYLSGETDIKRPDNASIESTLESLGITGSFVQGLERIKELPESDRKVYIRALMFLFSDCPTKDATEEPPFYLLYLLGRYLSRITHVTEYRVPYTLINEAHAAALLANPSMGTLKDYIKRMAKPEYIHHSNENDFALLADIQDELIKLRRELDIEQLQIMDVIATLQDEKPNEVNQALAEFGVELVATPK